MDSNKLFQIKIDSLEKENKELKKQIEELMATLKTI